MKRILSLTLAIVLLFSPLPAQAQRLYFPPPPPQRYAPPPPQQPYAPPPSSDWAHVAAIAPGTKVTVSAVGLSGQDSQYFVSATDRVLTLLVLFDSDLSNRAKNFVIKLLGTHPEMFMSPTRWGEYRDGPVRVNPDGVFVRSRKVADLSDITKTIRAGDVAQVSTWVKDDRPAPMPIDPALAGTAAILPISALALACGDGGHCSAGLAWGLLLGVPAALGIVHAVRASRRLRQEVIYRVR